MMSIISICRSTLALCIARAGYACCVAIFLSYSLPGVAYNNKFDPHVEVPETYYFSNSMPDGPLGPPVDAEIVAYARKDFPVIKEKGYPPSGSLDTWDSPLPGGLRHFNVEYNQPGESEGFFDAGIVYKMTLKNTGTVISGVSEGDHAEINFYKPENSTIEKAAGGYKLRVPVTVQLFKRGTLSPAEIDGFIKPVINTMYTKSVIFFLNKISDSPSGRIAVNTTVHVLRNSKTVHPDGGVFTGTSDVSTAAAAQDGALLGPPFAATVTLPYDSSSAPAAVKFVGPDTPGRMINDQFVYETGVRGIGFRISGKESGGLSPKDVTVTAGKKSAEVNVKLQFIRTGDINPGSKVAKVDNLGHLQVVSGEGEGAELIITDKPMTFSGSLVVDFAALGCE